MKLHYGPIPENPLFDPAADGWSPLKEPTPWVAQLLALPVAGAVCVGLLIAWRLVAPHASLGVLLEASMGWSLPVILACIPVHEGLHALGHPRQGRSPATLVGFWPAKLLFYAHYDDELSRNRFLWILAIPFLVLTVGPLVVCALASRAPAIAVSLTVVNGALGSLDLFGVGLVGLQLPACVRVRNKGWRTWWKMPPASGSPSSSL